ncbi:MAG: CbtA family protein [Geminicoccaceae bacterium]
MALFRNIVFTAALAGLLAGMLVTLMQHLSTVPMILEAETFEVAEAALTPATGAEHDHAAGAVHDHAGSGASDPAGHVHDESAWAPQDGFERTAFTLVANVITGVGFAMLLVAGYALRGQTIGWRQGLMWGMAGFAVFMLAPSLGLPPELPGMPAAPLGPRQLWWVLTAASTAAGLALLAFRRTPLLAVVAIALLVAPHLVGAPQPIDTETLVPEGLHHRFVVAVTVTSFLFWAALGVLSALLFERLGRDHAPTPAH